MKSIPDERLDAFTRWDNFLKPLSILSLRASSCFCREAISRLPTKKF